MCFMFAALIEFAFCNSLARLFVREPYEPFGQEGELTVSNQVIKYILNVNCESILTFLSTCMK